MNHIRFTFLCGLWANVYIFKRKKTTFYVGYGNPSKNPDVKTPLVVNFSLGFVIHFPSLTAF